MDLVIWPLLIQN